MPDPASPTSLCSVCKSDGMLSSLDSHSVKGSAGLLDISLSAPHLAFIRIRSRSPELSLPHLHESCQLKRDLIQSTFSLCVCVCVSSLYPPLTSSSTSHDMKYFMPSRPFSLSPLPSSYQAMEMSQPIHWNKRRNQGNSGRRRTQEEGRDGGSEEKGVKDGRDRGRGVEACQDDERIGELPGHHF